jgi:flagellar biosynthetic protein FliR
MITVTTGQWYAWMSAFLWPFLRIFGLILAEPILGHTSVPVSAKIGLAIFVSLVLTPVLPPAPPVELASAAGILIGLQQLLVGLAIGFTLRIALTAVETAGQFMGLQMGLGFAVFFDPQSSAQNAVMGQFLGQFALLVFLSMDGHFLVIAALARSFSSLPITIDPVTAGGFRVLVEWGGEIFRTGLVLSLPVVGALLIANIALGIMTRAAPQLNVFAVGFPLMLGVGFFAVWLSVPFVGPAIESLFEHTVSAALGIVEQLAHVAR